MRDHFDQFVHNFIPFFVKCHPCFSCLTCSQADTERVWGQPKMAETQQEFLERAGGVPLGTIEMEI